MICLPGSAGVQTTAATGKKARPQDAYLEGGVLSMEVVAGSWGQCLQDALLESSARGPEASVLRGRPARALNRGVHLLGAWPLLRFERPDEAVKQQPARGLERCVRQEPARVENFRTSESWKLLETGVTEGKSHLLGGAGLNSHLIGWDLVRAPPRLELAKQRLQGFLGTLFGDDSNGE